MSQLVYVFKHFEVHGRHSFSVFSVAVVGGISKLKDIARFGTLGQNLLLVLKQRQDLSTLSLTRLESTHQTCEYFSDYHPTCDKYHQTYKRVGYDGPITCNKIEYES